MTSYYEYLLHKKVDRLNDANFVSKVTVQEITKYDVRIEWIYNAFYLLVSPPPSLSLSPPFSSFFTIALLFIVTV